MKGKGGTILTCTSCMILWRVTKVVKKDSQPPQIVRSRTVLQTCHLNNAADDLGNMLIWAENQRRRLHEQMKVWLSMWPLRKNVALQLEKERDWDPAIQDGISNKNRQWPSSSFFTRKAGEEAKKTLHPSGAKTVLAGKWVGRKAVKLWYLKQEQGGMLLCPTFSQPTLLTRTEEKLGSVRPSVETRRHEEAC